MTEYLYFAIGAAISAIANMSPSLKRVNDTILLGGVTLLLILVWPILVATALFIGLSYLLGSMIKWMRLSL